MAKRRTFTVKVKDYGNDEINKLAVLAAIYDDLTAPQMQRMHAWLSDKYRSMLEQQIDEGSA